MSILNFYKLVYDRAGILDSIYEKELSQQLHFYRGSKTFDEGHRLTIQLREREAEYGELDLSDQAVVEPVKKIIRLNLIAPDDYFFGFDRFPIDLNYNTGLKIGLTTNTLDYFGLRIAQIFYQSIDENTHESITPIPVVFERYKYNWDANTDLPKGRIKEIQFYYQDGSLTEQKKILPKEFYNTSDRADINTKRRSTIVSWLIARAVELGLNSEITSFFNEHKLETDTYILYGDLAILNQVQNSDSTANPWLETDTTTEMGTVRQAILLSLSKALEPTPDAEVTQFLSGLGL